MNKSFNCDKCGLCCQNLNLSDEYSDLNDGTGACIYYDHETHLCKIYDHRPEKCNIAASYNRFADLMTYDEYLELNYLSCHHLKEKGNK